jgi:hypothetical protein
MQKSHFACGNAEAGWKSSPVPEWDMSSASSIPTPFPAAVATYLPGMQHPYTFPSGSGNVFARYAASLHLPPRQRQSFLPGMQHPHTFPGGSGNVFARYATSLHLPRRQRQRFCQVCNIPTPSPVAAAPIFQVSLHLPRRQRQCFCQV